MRKGFALVCSVFLLQGQGLPDKETILDSIITRYDHIEDYSVRVTMSVTMPKFRMPRKKIDIYYKNPGKLKIESDGFAIVPKAGITMSPDLFLSHIENMDILPDPKGGIRIVGDAVADSLAGLMMGRGDENESTLVHLIIHVNRDHWYIDDVVIQRDSLTVFRITSTYEEVTDNIWMPVETTMMIRMTSGMQANMPDHAAADMGLSDDKPFEGEIVVRYSRYRINKGIKDSFFNEADAVF